MNTARRVSILILSAFLCCTALRAPSLAQSTGGATETELVFGAPGGTFQKIWQANILPLFEKKYGVKVVYVTGTTPELLAKVRATASHPELDVTFGIDYTQYVGVKQGLYATLDPSVVSNLADLYPFARYPHDIGMMGGLQYVALEYNTQIFKQKGWAPPTSWYDLWDPKFKGHVALYSLPAGFASQLLGLIAILEGGSPSNLEPAWKKFAQLSPNVLSYELAPAQIDLLLTTGAAWITYNGNARIADLAATGFPVAAANPKEGVIASPNPFDIVKGGPHPKLAQLFMNFVLSPEVQEVLAKSMGLGPVNKKVKLDPATAERVPYGDKMIKSLRWVDTTPINADLDDLVHRWDTTIAKK